MIPTTARMMTMIQMIVPMAATTTCSLLSRGDR